MADGRGGRAALRSDGSGLPGASRARAGPAHDRGIDDTLDAAIVTDYHSGTTNPRGVRAHTMSSAADAGGRIHGIAMSEASFNAALADHFGVPVVMIAAGLARLDEWSRTASRVPSTWSSRSRAICRPRCSAICPESIG